MKRGTAVIILLAAIALLAAVALWTSQYVTITLKHGGSRDEVVEKTGETFVNILLNIPVGNLAVTGNSPHLLEGNFKYEQGQWDAQIAYLVSSGMGTLSVIQPNTNGSPASPKGYDYGVQLSKTVPMSLQVDRLIGDNNLMLSDLLLSTVNANLGNGDNQVILRGEQKTLSSMLINGGTGIDKLDMNCTCEALTNLVASLGASDDSVSLDGTYPQLTSINIDGNTGNDSVMLKGNFPAISTLTLNLGQGDDSVMLAGDMPELHSLVINGGAGNDTIDLDAPWKQDLSATIISESDSTRLKLPKDIGVMVQVFGKSVEVDAGGLTKQDNGYVNAAYGKSNVTLHISLNTSATETVKLVVE
jgi:hypothetical protein